MGSGGCILFFKFLKIKGERGGKKNSEVPVAKSVNDTHNGVLTRVIIELDSTQRSAKTNLLCSADLGMPPPEWDRGRRVDRRLPRSGNNYVPGQLALLTFLWAPVGRTGARVSYEPSARPQLGLSLLLDLSFSLRGLG